MIFSSLLFFLLSNDLLCFNALLSVLLSFMELFTVVFYVVYAKFSFFIINIYLIHLSSNFCLSVFPEVVKRDPARM